MRNVVIQVSKFGVVGDGVSFLEFSLCTCKWLEVSKGSGGALLQFYFL